MFLAYLGLMGGGSDRKGGRGGELVRPLGRTYGAFVVATHIFFRRTKEEKQSQLARPTDRPTSSSARARPDRHLVLQLCKTRARTRKCNSPFDID